ncbi:uncharacterized protein LOC120199350 [Hibiscus syriacus]|uniref:uncharacterized protein LOC120199350 n=1 Tax=Hibiscus syriacus TaxID=106335 RepID=UPI001922C816|nr:uncharacterized protein LOC120199350 [Hibiscus syriacus]
MLDTNRSDVRQILEVSNEKNPEKYLGLPSIVERNKKGAFVHLFDNFRSHIRNWSVKAFSQGGPYQVRAPSYSFILYELLASPLDPLFGIKKYNGQLLLPKVREQKGNSLVFLECPLAVKRKLWFGFRYLAKFNIALLAKYGWWLLIYPTSFFDRLYRAKYYPTGDFLSSSVGAASSTFDVVFGVLRVFF